MSLKKFLTSRLFLINLLLMVGLIAILLIITMFRIRGYTHHGVSYEVPSFSGLTFEASEKLAKSSSLEIEIKDSVYSKFAAPGTIVDQVPRQGKRVKEGRLIYLTINSLEPEKVELPKLTDISFRQAQVLLDKCGVFIEGIEYAPSEYNDLVLSVKQNSAEVNEGDMVIKGSSVIIVVGQTTRNLAATLPDLNGLFLEEARAALMNARLNIGALIYDQTIVTRNDSLNARVWKQMPDSKTTNKVTQGSSVDLWLSTAPEEHKNEANQLQF